MKTATTDRRRRAAIAVAALLAALPAPRAAHARAGGWPDFADETATRLVAAPSVGAADVQEKDYAWGDLDQDGDVDLVVVRKEPWNTTGRFRNVLLLNEGTAEGHAIDGVLVDRTADLASAADDGGQGMLDLTNDRDVVVVDVTGDGWPDVVTATTYGEQLPKTISHPRVYVNRGESGGVWQGLRYEEARTPLLPMQPHFSSVAAGDVNGDGAPDLYFTDYNNLLEDRLWINDGSGTFADETLARLTPEMRESDFGVHAVIADMNGDGANDVVKDRGSTRVVPPLRVSITWNDPVAAGTFDAFEIVYEGNPYHVEVGDLNGDGRLDLVIDDDGLDRYLLNQGNGPDGRADFLGFTFPAASDSFGGNIVVRDLDNDGRNDVLVADVDVDCCGCDRHMHLWRNVGLAPDAAFVEATGGIPDAARTGTHDVAVLDLNGDGWLDLVIGTCTGTTIWVAQPALRFTFASGSPPAVVAPDRPHVFQVTIDAQAGAELDPASVRLHAAAGDGPVVTTALVPLGGNVFEGTLPPVACVASVTFHLSATTLAGGAFTDPPDAPASFHVAVATAGTSIAFQDDVEGADPGWSVENDPSLTGGAWVAADPNGTIGIGSLAAPDDDATPGAASVRAWVTENGPPGATAAAFDVDGGPTTLVSPVLDLSGGDATISYARWFSCEDEGAPGADVLTVDVSSDGGATWTALPGQTTGGTGGAWEQATFVVGDHVTPTDAVRVRFRTSDAPNDSVTEAGIDDFTVAVCGADCPADVDDDAGVGFADLNALLGAWGPCPSAPAPCPADLDASGGVGFADLAALLAAWGPC